MYFLFYSEYLLLIFKAHKDWFYSCGTQFTVVVFNTGFTRCEYLHIKSQDTRVVYCVSRGMPSQSVE